MATDEQREAVQAMLRRSAAIGKTQHAALREMRAVGSTDFRYGDQLVQLLGEDIELFRLAQAAVNTWRPGVPPADLRGGRSYLVGMTRAVDAVEAADPSGNFLALRERVEASARRLRAAARSARQRRSNVGLSPVEIVEALTHAAVYCGFPKALNAVFVAKRVFAEHDLLPVQPPSRTTVPQDHR